MPDYTVEIVNKSGTVQGSTLVNPNVKPIVWTLNEPTETGFTLPKVDPLAGSGQYANVDLLDKEARIKRDGTILTWGPMIYGELDSSKSDIDVTVPDVSWYFHRRQVSDARANLLSNGTMEAGSPPTSWTNTGASTDTSSTTHVLMGSKALKLSQSTAGVDTFSYQQVAVTGTAIGTLLTVAAWVYIDDTSWVGPAFESRGLFVSGIESSVVKDYRFVEIDDATPRNRWVRLEVTIWVPPNKTWTIEVRLYAPGADVWWDAAVLVAMESLSHYATDLGTIAGNIVDFIQNTTHGWDDLNITTSDVSSGILVDRHYQYADHIGAMDALQEIEEMGLDWAMVFTSTTRVFTTYYPKGTDRSGSVTLRMRSSSNPTGTLSHYKLTKDGAATSTRVTVLGEGDGPDREEGYAVDTSSLGGLTLGEVITAPAGAPISYLQPIAANRLAKSKKLVRILEVTGIPGDTTQITTLVVGDTVAVDITDGGETINGNWRVVQKTLDPALDTASFVLNEV